MPIRPDQKPTIHSLLSLDAVGDLRYNTFKMLLTNGMQVRRALLYYGAFSIYLSLLT
jgi:hypothetical protein